MLLEIKDLDVGYAKRVVVHGLSMTVEEGEIVAIIGHNGAGKTTTLKGIFGLIQPFRGEILYNGMNIVGRAPANNIQDGITFLPQERFIFPELNVSENLYLGAYTANKEDVQFSLEIIYRLFPVLKERSWQRSSTLSGGERRMLGIGMTLITRPRLLILDEPSLGLAPVLVKSLFESFIQIREELGTSVVLVEQNVKQAMGIAHRVYVMKMGCKILEETGENLLQKEDWWDLF
jgi:branched-chain amino acid transport system ATP-binding protein